MNWLFNVTINDISVIYVTAHRCAGGLTKKLDLRSGSQRHRHFVGFFNVPVQAPTRGSTFLYGDSPVRAMGVKSRMSPPYPKRDRKRRLNGAVCRNRPREGQGG